MYTGTLDNLLPYETKRQSHVVSMIAAINGLNDLYSSELLPIVMARNFGVTLTDSISSIKVTKNLASKYYYAMLRKPIIYYLYEFMPFFLFICFLIYINC